LHFILFVATAADILSLLFLCHINSTELCALTSAEHGTVAFSAGVEMSNLGNSIQC